MQNACYKLILLALLFNSGNLYAGIREHFLSHGPSVSAYGKGETGTAVFEDNSSLFYNPALLAEALSNGVVLSEHTLFDGTAYSYIGINGPLSTNYGSISVSAINLKSGEVEIRRNIYDSPELIHTNQWAYSVTYAKKITDLYSLNMGFTIKYIYYDMFKYSGGGVGADCGLSREYAGPAVFGNDSKIVAGASILNVVPPKIRLIDYETLNTIDRAGIAFMLPVIYRVVSYDRVSVFADMILAENMLNTAFGAEYCFVQKYTIRCGYYKEHPTAGAGIAFKGIGIDYALDFGPIDYINRFSLSYLWGFRGKAEVKLKRNYPERTLLSEAKQALEQSKKDNREIAREVAPLFRSALKDYRKKRYLKAADKFREIAVKYPDYENALLYYKKINDKMNEEARSASDSDYEKETYARGYVNYSKKELSEAVSEWEKVLQMDPERTEIGEYLANVKTYLKDAERIEKEKDIEDRVAKLFEAGKANYTSKKWVSCIKTMEKVRDTCKSEAFRSSAEWSLKAREFINNSITELSRSGIIIPDKTGGNLKEDGQEKEIDIHGADKKYTEGLVLYAQGKISDAIRSWEIAIRLNPALTKAHKALEKAREEIAIGGQNSR